MGGSPTEAGGDAKTRAMGWSRNTNLGCHTCKRRFVGRGHKRGGSMSEAREAGWAWMVRSTLGERI
jgi:hypothetical protein